MKHDKLCELHKKCGYDKYQYMHETDYCEWCCKECVCPLIHKVEKRLKRRLKKRARNKQR